MPAERSEGAREQESEESEGERESEGARRVRERGSEGERGELPPRMRQVLST